MVRSTFNVFYLTFFHPLDATQIQQSTFLHDLTFLSFLFLPNNLVKQPLIMHIPHGLHSSTILPSPPSISSPSNGHNLTVNIFPVNYSTLLQHLSSRFFPLLPHITIPKFFSFCFDPLGYFCFVLVLSSLVTKMQEQPTSSIAASSIPSSSEKSSSSALHVEVKEGIESDEEIRRVPEIGVETAGPSASRPESGSGAATDRVQGTGEGHRKRGRNSADKESKRLKRLLRNRVSAQQARERKKAYLIDLETRVKDLEKKNSELEERLSTLQNENQMLRHILKNTTASRRGGTGAEGTM